MSKEKNSKAARLENKYNSKNALVNYYLALMFAVFPLFFTDGLFQIRHDKLYFFLAASGMILLAVGCLVFIPMIDKQKSVPKVVNESPKLSLSIVDYAMLALLIVSIISSLFSPYLKTGEPIFGAPNGRNNGLLLIAFYVAVYFVITRYFYYCEYVFIALAIGSSLVCLLSVLNFFYIDPLAVYERMVNQADVERFTSTIGNKNILSSFICIALPAMIAMSVHTKKRLYQSIYLTAVGLGFASLMTADSDSGILGMGVLVVVLLIWYSRHICRLKRYFLAMTVMFASAKLVGLFYPLLESVMGKGSKEMDFFQKIFIFSNASYIIIAISAILTVLLFIIDFKHPNLNIPKLIPIVISSLFLLFIAAIIGTVIYFSVFNTSADLGPFATIFRFNEKWGTHRGFMWIKSVEIFGNMNFFQALFGTGPDTYYYEFMPYFGELMKFGDGSTNAAHNEYINYLITIGIFGLGAYLTAVIGVIVRAIKAAKKSSLAIVCSCVVICYSVQAFVNISSPITTPLFIIFLALTEAVCRKSKYDSCAR